MKTRLLWTMPIQVMKIIYWNSNSVVVFIMTKTWMIEDYKWIRIRVYLL